MRNVIQNDAAAMQAAGMPAPLINIATSPGATIGDLRGMILEMRANAPLPEDAQKLIDDKVIEVGLDRLAVYDDILSFGRFPLDDAMSIMEVQWEVIAKTGGAIRVMEPRARGENQLPRRTSAKIPIYITMDDFHLGTRLLGASRRVGQPLDLRMVGQATRRVNEAIEDATIYGAGLQVAGNGTPGLLDAPNVNFFAYGSGEAWTAAGHSGQDIIDDLFGMIAMLHATGIRRFGPYSLVLNTAYSLRIGKTFSDGVTTFPKTIRQQIQDSFPGLVIVTSDQMPANKTILYERNPDVVDAIDGFAPMAVPWTGPTPWELHWNVMAIQVPRVMTDFEETSGIVVGDLTLP